MPGGRKSSGFLKQCSHPSMAEYISLSCETHFEFLWTLGTKVLVQLFQRVWWVFLAQFNTALWRPPNWLALALSSPLDRLGAGFKVYYLHGYAWTGPVYITQSKLYILNLFYISHQLSGLFGTRYGPQIFIPGYWGLEACIVAAKSSCQLFTLSSTKRLT